MNESHFIMNANQPNPTSHMPLGNLCRFTVFPDSGEPLELPAFSRLLKAEPRLMAELAAHATIAIAIQVLCIVMN